MDDVGNIDGSVEGEELELGAMLGLNEGESDGLLLGTSDGHVLGS